MSSKDEIMDDENPFGDWGKATAGLIDGVVNIGFLDRSVCFLELIKQSETDGKELIVGRGTGTWVKHNGTLFLLTNWHVLTGLHHETREWLDTTRACHPDRIKIYFNGVGNGDGRLTFAVWSQNLWFNHNGKQRPIWKVHPDVGSYWDLAVLEIYDESTKSQAVAIKIETKDIWKILPRDFEVKVIGYPLTSKSISLSLNAVLAHRSHNMHLMECQCS